MNVINRLFYENATCDYHSNYLTHDLKQECIICPDEPFKIITPKLQDLDMIAFKLPIRYAFENNLLSEMDKINQHVAFVGLILTSLTLPSCYCNDSLPETKYVWIAKNKKNHTLYNVTYKGDDDFEFVTSLYPLDKLVKYIIKHTNITISFYKLANNPLNSSNNFEWYCKVIDIFQDIKKKENGLLFSFFHFLIGLSVCVSFNFNLQINNVKEDFCCYENDMNQSSCHSEYMFTYDSVNIMYNRLGITSGTPLTNKLNCPLQSSLFSSCFNLFIGK